MSQGRLVSARVLILPAEAKFTVRNRLEEEARVCLSKFNVRLLI